MYSQQGPVLDFEIQDEIQTEALHQVALQEFSPIIKVKNTQFHLRGVVGFNHYGAVSDLGHYIAYALRYDGKWEAYNDLIDKAELTALTHKIVPHLLFYSV